ncbi:MAG: hypothetical protein NTZ05_04150 [Chloroflexi bacterium]|nr:hypothetical protein [Chloroflexota bacterium]
MAVLGPVPLLSTAVLTANSAATDVIACPVKTFEVVTVGFSGTLDIKGSWDGGANWSGLPYWNLSSAVRATAQLSYTTSTARVQYVVLAPCPLIRLEMTRSAGSISSSLTGSSDITPYVSINSSQLPASLTAEGTLQATNIATAINGASLYKFRNLSSTVQTIKAGAGTIFSLIFYNTSGAANVLQLFDVSGTVTLGTTTPDWEWTTAAAGISNTAIPVMGIPFVNAIKIASTTAEAGAAGSAAGVMVWAVYK